VITASLILAITPRKPLERFRVMNSLLEFFDMVEATEHTHVEALKARDRFTRRMN